MADIKEMRIFCAEQIEVPDALPEILKNYSKYGNYYIETSFILF